MAEFPTPGTISCSAAHSATSTAALEEIRSSALIGRTSEALGAHAKLHIVGGTVRDLLAGLHGGDIDLACALPPMRTRELLERANFKVVETGLKHGTLTVVYEGRHLEITSYRRTSDRKTTGEPNIIDDLSGRDFTINSMAYSLQSGELLDPFGGQADLRAAILRATGSALARFSEDALRILRMVRLGPAAGRQIEVSTAQAARQQAFLLPGVSAERIRTELERILLSQQAAAGLRALRDFELLQHTLPELTATVGFEQNKFHVHDVFEHTLHVIERCPRDLILRLTALFHDIGKPQTLSIDEDGSRHFYCHENLSSDICKQRMQALRFSGEQIRRVCHVVRMHMRPIECGPAGVRRLLRDLGEDFDIWKSFKRADAPPLTPQAEFEECMQIFENLVAAEQRLRLKAQRSGLAVTGDDLIRLGFKPGPELGRALKQLEDSIIENPDFNTQERLLSQARKLLSQ